MAQNGAIFIFVKFVVVKTTSNVTVRLLSSHISTLFLAEGI